MRRKWRRSVRWHLYMRGLGTSKATFGHKTELTKLLSKYNSYKKITKPQKKQKIPLKLNKIQQI